MGKSMYVLMGFCKRKYRKRFWALKTLLENKFNVARILKHPRQMNVEILFHNFLFALRKLRSSSEAKEQKPLHSKLMKKIAIIALIR
jgi:hypothetical protein